MAKRSLRFDGFSEPSSSDRSQPSLAGTNRRLVKVPRSRSLSPPGSPLLGSDDISISSAPLAPSPINVAPPGVPVSDDESDGEEIPVGQPDEGSSADMEPTTGDFDFINNDELSGEVNHARLLARDRLAAEEVSEEIVDRPATPPTQPMDDPTPTLARTSRICFRSDLKRTDEHGNLPLSALNYYNTYLHCACFKTHPFTYHYDECLGFSYRK